MKTLTILLIAGAALTAAPGFAKSCVSLPQVKDQRIVEGGVLFREGSRWFRNDLRGNCPFLKANRAISSVTPSTNLCSGDLVRVFQPTGKFEYGACALGEFTAVDKPR